MGGSYRQSYWHRQGPFEEAYHVNMMTMESRVSHSSKAQPDTYKQSPLRKATSRSVWHTGLEKVGSVHRQNSQTLFQ